MSRTPEELVAFVRVMREMGVSEADGIKLGPDPKLAERSVQESEASLAEKRAIAHRDTMFAACSVKPKLKFLRGGGQ